MDIFARLSRLSRVTKAAGPKYSRNRRLGLGCMIMGSLLNPEVRAAKAYANYANVGSSV